MSPDPRSIAKRKRLVLLLKIGVFLLVAAFLLRPSQSSRPIGTGPAGPAVSRDGFKDPWTTRQVLLLGVGDSITAGFGASRGHSYLQRLVSNPQDEFPDMRGLCLSAVLPNLGSRNIAVSGSTSLQHIDMLMRLETFPPDVLGLVVMTTGGNDIIHDYGRSPPREGAMYGATLAQARPWIEAFEQRLSTMIDRLEACFPGGCHIFLANIYDPTDGAGDAENAGLPNWPDGLQVLHAYNDVIARCAHERDSVNLVNIHDTFLGHGIHCAHRRHPHYRQDDPHYWYFENLEDPNDRGYDAIRRLFLIEIGRVVGSTTTTAPSQAPSSSHPTVGRHSPPSV